MNSNRSPKGGRVNRERPILFRFNNTYYKGLEGDTLASALLANDIHMVARSIKYGRPRGIVSSGTEEPNAIVQLNLDTRSTPNMKATEIDLHAGLVANSSDFWPSGGFNLKALARPFHSFMAAGFYYKTMFASKRLWRYLFEPIIRRVSGFGTAPTQPDPDCYDHIYKSVDVLVVGAGPAGLAAARDASASGARVIIADEQSRFGGSLLHLKRKINSFDGIEWVDAVVAELTNEKHTTLLPKTTVIGYFDQNYCVAVEQCQPSIRNEKGTTQVRERLWHIRAEKVILATGAHERPLVFADNDRPGIMLASAVQNYVNRYAVLPGKRAILFTNNDAAYEAALDFRKAGGDLVAVIDCRQNPTGPLVDKLFSTGTRLLRGHVVSGTSGKWRFQALKTSPWDGSAISGKSERFEADILMMSGGWNPVVHLFSQSSGKLKYHEEKSAFLPNQYGQKDCIVIGSANGDFTLADALRSGSREGVKAGKQFGSPSRKTARRYSVDEPDTGTPEACWRVPFVSEETKSSCTHFVDFQNDTTVADIEIANSEGFDSVELMKRYTLAGFGTDQGKTGNINALAILACASGRSISQTGTTTFRPPYKPVTLGVLAGQTTGKLFSPVRTSPIHPAHIELGAKFENVGHWQRPHYYPQGEETMKAAVDRECVSVRTSVGMLDASTLGKIDIQGPDAAEFLNRLYLSDIHKVSIGKCRYSLMCKEDGMVFDDGIVAKLGEGHFGLSSTTSGAIDVLHHIQDCLQTEWPELKVYCTSVTEQWAKIVVTGPNARAVIEALLPTQDWSAQALPHMSFRFFETDGIPMRVIRVSFTGELSFEVNVPARYGLSLWNQIAKAGAPFGITPYGTEAMHVLRAEKGYILIGQDTDGSQTPQDLGLDWICAKKRKDFIGKRSQKRPDMQKSDRKQLVGLKTEDPTFVLEEGAQIVQDAEAPIPIPMIGYVTSSYWSETLGHSIALALIEGGFARKGEQFFCYSLGKWHKINVVEPIFYDIEGARRDG